MDRRSLPAPRDSMKRNNEKWRLVRAKKNLHKSVKNEPNRNEIRMTPDHQDHENKIRSRGARARAPLFDLGRLRPEISKLTFSHA